MRPGVHGREVPPADDMSLIDREIVIKMPLTGRPFDGFPTVSQ